MSFWVVQQLSDAVPALVDPRSARRAAELRGRAAPRIAVGSRGGARHGAVPQWPIASQVSTPLPRALRRALLAGARVDRLRIGRSVRAPRGIGADVGAAVPRVGRLRKTESASTELHTSWSRGGGRSPRARHRLREPSRSRDAHPRVPSSMACRVRREHAEHRMVEPAPVASLGLPRRSPSNRKPSRRITASEGWLSVAAATRMRCTGELAEGPRQGRAVRLRSSCLAPSASLHSQ